MLMRSDRLKLSLIHSKSHFKSIVSYKYINNLPLSLFKSLALNSFSTSTSTSTSNSNKPSNTHDSQHIALLQQNLYSKDLPFYMNLHFLTSKLKLNILILRSFNIEITSINESITETKNGLLRLQWWNDIIDIIYNDNNNNEHLLPKVPIVKFLNYITHSNSLTKKYFTDYMDSRSLDFQKPNFQTLDSLVSYTQFTQGSLFVLSLECLNIRDENSVKAAYHYGVSYGIYLYLRSIPLLIANKQLNSLILPTDLYKKYDVGQDTDNLSSAIFDIACVGKSHLEEAEKIQLSKDAKKIFLVTCQLKEYYENLEKENFEIWKMPIDKINPLYLQLKMWRYSWK